MGIQHDLPVTDQELITAIIDRDRKVFELFYKTYYKQLFAVAYRYIGNRQQAEEIVHDVFIVIWNKGEQLNIQQSVKSYLFRSVVNSSLNAIKREKMDTERRASYLSQYDPEVASTSEQQEEAEAAVMCRLEEALGMLPEKCRQVMYLSRFGKMKQKDIAEQMNISIKTVKNHLTYGFNKLREHMAKHNQTTIHLLIFLTINALHL